MKAKETIREVQRCYEQALSNGLDRGGDLRFEFTIVPGGTVENVLLERDTLQEPAVTACVAAVLATWRFPEGPWPLTFSYPYRFAPR